MRKTLLFSMVALVLSACGGDTTTITCENGYADGVVGACLPDAWHVVDRSQLDDRGIPGEVVVAFQSDAPYAGQFPTVTVTRESLPQAMTSEDYSDASVVSVQTLAGYEEVDQRDVNIDGATVTLHVFTAQPHEDQPQSRFYQVSAVSPGNVGFTFTGATPVSVPDELETNVIDILRSMTLVDTGLPTEEGNGN